MTETTSKRLGSVASNKYITSICKRYYKVLTVEDYPYYHLISCVSRMTMSVITLRVQPGAQAWICHELSFTAAHQIIFACYTSQGSTIYDNCCLVWMDCRVGKQWRIARSQPQRSFASTLRVDHNCRHEYT